MSDQEWSWDNESDQCDVVFPTTRGVAIYMNDDGGVVIRQQGERGEDDAFIIVQREHAIEIADALKAL